MKKKTWILAGTALLAVLTACGAKTSQETTAGTQKAEEETQQEAAAGETAAAESAPEEQRYDTPEIVISLSDINNEDSALGQASAKFAQLVDERSKGRIKIETYYSGQLGNETENIENLRTGVVGITRINVANLENRGIAVPEYTLFGLPYLLRGQEHAKKVLESAEVKELSDQISEVTGGEIVSMDAYIVASPRHFFSKKPVKTMADFAGMKVRSETTDLKIDTMKAFGMSATPLSLNDMYSSLQTGMIDGGEHNLSNIQSYAFYEQCPYVLLTAHNYNVNLYLISGFVWSSLAQEDQQMIQTAMKEACDWCTEYSQEEDEKLREELEAKGTTFTEPQDLEAWQGAAEKLYEKYAAGHEAFVEKILSYAE